MTAKRIRMVLLPLWEEEHVSAARNRDEYRSAYTPNCAFQPASFSRLVTTPPQATTATRA